MISIHPYFRPNLFFLHNHLCLTIQTQRFLHLRLFYPRLRGYSLLVGDFQDLIHPCTKFGKFPPSTILTYATNQEAINFKRSYTKKAGQTNDFKIAKTVPQKPVDSEI